MTVSARRPCGHELAGFGDARRLAGVRASGEIAGAGVGVVRPGLVLHAGGGEPLRARGAGSGGGCLGRLAGGARGRLRLQASRSLFAESAAVRQADLWDLHAPDLPRGSDSASDGTVDFVLRSGLNVTVTRDAQWRPLTERTVTAFTDALNRSPLNAVLMRLAVGGAPAGGMNPFHRHGLNRSRLVRLAWSGSPDGWPQDRPGPAEASVRLEVPGGYGHTAAHMRVEADVVVRRSAAIDIARQQRGENAPHALPPHWSVPPQHLTGSSTQCSPR